jgi:hypothetical protein
MLSVIHAAESRKQAHYDDCHYTECRYAECRGAMQCPYSQISDQGPML